MTIIYAIKTQEALFVTLNPQKGAYNVNMSHLIINGETPKPSFHSNWYVVSSIPEVVETKKTRYENRRFELSNPELFPNLQLSYPYDEVVVDDEDDDIMYISSFSPIASLYHVTSDLVSSVEQVDFELTILADIETIPDMVPFRHKVSKVNSISERDVKYSLISEITVPSILLHETPSHLSSRQSYDIIRQYIKENINLTAARIISDYDFCFAISKVIELHTPEKYEVDVNNLSIGGRKRKPRYETRFRKTREVKIFEMTHSERPQQGYTVIEGFKGNTQAELTENIDKYLADLMLKINEVLKDCPCCKGYGVVSDNFVID